MFPTALHEDVASALTRLLAFDGVHAVLLVGSCARGLGVDDMDLHVFAPPDVHAEVWRRFTTYESSDAVYARFRDAGGRHHVDLDVSDADFELRPRGWTSGPDDFELRLGNWVAYARPLWQCDGFHDGLRDRWMPFYDDDLRAERLAGVLRFGRNNLDHVAGAVSRGQPFQAFKRLYDAHLEFLQALHIAHRVYPVAYDKWILEQLDRLGLPDVHDELVRVVGVPALDGASLLRSRDNLAALFDGYCLP